MIRRLPELLITGSTVLLCVLLFAPGVTSVAGAEVHFDRLAGTDLGMGIGARAIGMAGAVVSAADDASAVYWNPSGLAEMDDNQLLVSVNVLNDFSAAAVTYRPEIASLEAYRMTLGLALINRLSFKGDSGTETWDGYAAHLLNLAMIPAGEDFSGAVASRTMDVRLSLAIRFPRFKNWALGVTVAHIS